MGWFPLYRQMDRTPIHLAPLVSYQKPQESPSAVVPVLVVGNKLRAKGDIAMVTAKQQTLDSLPDFFSVDAFAQVIGLSRASAYRLAAQPGFPCLRIGRRIILSRDHVRQWINRGMGVM